VSLSYVDRFRISVTGKQSIFSEKDLILICNLVEEKFKNLSQEVKSDV